MTNEVHKINTCEVANFSGLKSNLEKKFWFWIGFVITLNLLFIFNGFHLTITAFICALFLSISVGYCLWNIRRLILCTRFLKSWIGSESETSINERSSSQAFKITRRCLHQFSLSLGFIIFAIIAFLATPSYLFDFPHLLLLSIICTIIYGFSLLFVHAHIAARIGHPIIHCLRAFKPIHDFDPMDFPSPPAYITEPDPIKEMEKVNERLWEAWMHDPANPASAEYLADPWHKRHGDNY